MFNSKNNKLARTLLCKIQAVVIMQPSGLNVS